MKRLILILSLLLGIPALAQMPEHVLPDVKRGELHGFVYQIQGQIDDQGKKIPLTQQNIGLMVFNQGTRVLILEKNSDDEGKFTFKNIFQDPNYTYSLGTILDDQLYVVTQLQLAKGQDIIAVDFQVGLGSPNMKGPVEALMLEAEQAEQVVPEARHQPEVKSAGMETFQKIALILSGIVLVIAVIMLAKGPERV